MILRRLQLPGKFVQAHRYLDTLWLMRMDGTVQALDLESHASERLNGSGSAAAKAFARNDRLVITDGALQLDAQAHDVRRFPKA